MTFDLYIEIAGLCLLYRTADELLVLLPHTTEGHEHYPVLASDEKYQPDRKPGEGRVDDHCVYHDLGEGHITFATKPEDAYLEKVLERGYAIHNLEGCSKRKVLPHKALVQVHLPHGQPGTMHPMGAHWKPNGSNSTPVLMATRLSWKIAGLMNTVGGETPGIVVPITPAKGENYNVVLKPPAGSREVHMQLYHTLADELPCATLKNPDSYKTDQEAPHFRQYLSLFEADHTCQIPLFSHIPDETALSASIRALAAEAEQRVSIRAADSGRRYSCMLATVWPTEIR